MHLMGKPHDDVLDAVIVGAGAAGLAAATLLGRSRRRVMVIGGTNRANSDTEAVHNLPYADGIPPATLYAAMEETLARYGVSLIAEQVESIAEDEARATFAIGTKMQTFRARRLVLAQGVEYAVPTWVPSDAWGKSVFTCPFCHAYEHSGEDFVVVAVREEAVTMALLCATHARTLTVIVDDTDTAAGEAADRIRKHGGMVVVGAVQTAQITETGDLVIYTASGKEYRAGAVLVTGAMRQRNSLTSQLGLQVSAIGFPQTDDDGRSSNPRVWVAGTAARPRHLLAETIGSGTRAGISVHMDMCLEGL